jgi:hypothetical protein
MKILTKLLFIGLLSFVTLDTSAIVRKYSTCPYPEHEFSFGYGAFSSDQLGVRTGRVFGNPTLEGIVTREDATFTLTPIGPFYLNYKYFFKEKLSVGAGIIYANNRIMTQPDNGTSFTDIYQSLAIVPSMDFYYVRNPKIAVYGALKAGPDLRFFQFSDKQESFDVGLAFQIVPIAIRAGRSFGIVIELGLGNYGVANGGFSYRHYNRPWGT